MRNEIARLRHDLDKIDDVSATWFEWSLENSEMIRTLVVEVDFDTDPDSKDFRQDVLHEVESIALNTIMAAFIPTTHLRVVPKRERRLTGGTDTPQGD